MSILGPEQVNQIAIDGEAIVDVYDDAGEHIWTPPPRITSFAVTPDHVDVGDTSVEAIVLTGLVTGARTFEVSGPDGLIASRGQRWPISPVPAGDADFTFTAENVGGEDEETIHFVRSTPCSVSLADQGARPDPQPGGGVLITRAVQATVTGWPLPVTLAWSGGGISDAALQNHFNRATPSGRTRVFTFNLVRSRTGRQSTAHYSLTARNRFSHASANIDLLWP